MRTHAVTHDGSTAGTAISPAEARPEPDDAATAGRQVKGTLAKTVLSYVRRVLGSEGVAAVLQMIDEPLATKLAARSVWLTKEEAIAVATAAAAVCGDEDIGRRTGEEMKRIGDERGDSEFVVATGSVGAALAWTTNVATKMSTGKRYRLIDFGDGWATVEGIYHRSEDAHPFFCGVHTGYHAMLPELFGFASAASEPECMARGDAVCRYEFRWWAKAGGQQPAAEAIASAAAAAKSFVDGFEQLHKMATELASAESVDTVLDRIMNTAAVTISAPAYVLAVRTRPDSHLRIHHKGSEDERAATLAQRLLAGDLDQDPRYLIADVSSSEATYGRIVAIYPRGATVTEFDRRLIAAYAMHAAAALEAVAALERANRDRDIAEALLRLAESLAEVGTRSEVAQRLAGAVPAVAGCHRLGVWLWDPSKEALRLEAHFPERMVHVRGPSSFPAGAEHELVGLRAPVVMSVSNTPLAIRQAMGTDDLLRCAVAPIRARGEFLGIVTAGFAESPTRGPDADRSLLALLGALADQAATAFDNADLLQHVRDQALHDSLTGLPNRTLVEDRAQQALVQRAHHTPSIALLFIDLDRFKNVNDTFGHDIGDQLICQAADRLRASTRSSDTVARLGGDEFVVLLPDLADETAAERVADKIIAAFKQPFSPGGHEVFISCSIGIASAPQHGTGYATLLQNADGAMYQAKEAGRSTFAVHAVGTGSLRRGKFELETQLHLAVDRHELHLLYQPQIDLTTMRIVGVEALVRWDHPALGRIGPDLFIPLAEESGLIADIDGWVRHEALSQARTWLDRGIDLRMAVNLSTRVLRDPRLAQEVGDLIDALRLRPDRVELEVTDRVVMDEYDLADALAPLDALGVRLAIDDFGAGTSVLGRLQRCPVDTLKIDRSFIATIDSTSNEAPVVSALLSMAKNMRLEIVAEGVETVAQAAFLRHNGCHMVQGFFFSPPIEAIEIEQLVGDQLQDFGAP
jgi:diguanylate cyclase (GGDEF)-like protein